jgi:hypothetical protein
MRSAGGAISGVEFGVEPQVNNSENSPLKLVIEKYLVTVDNIEHGMQPLNYILPETPPYGTVNAPLFLDDLVRLSGSATGYDGNGISSVEVALLKTNNRTWFDFNGGFSSTVVREFTQLSDSDGSETQWSLDITTLPPGRYRIRAIVFDQANNASEWIRLDFQL